MKRIRIGKDIHVSWEVTVDGIHRDLSVLDLSLVLGNEVAGTEQSLPFTTDFDKVLAEYPGIEHVNTGVYRLTLWLNKGSDGQSVLDNSDAFQLVSRTEMEGGTDNDNLVTETVELAGNITTNDGGLSMLEPRVATLEAQCAEQAEQLTRVQKAVRLVALTTPIEALSPEVDTYTRLAFPVDALAVTLPAIADATRLHTLSLSFSTGTAPAVSFEAEDGAEMAYFDGFAIDAETNYEISCLYDGEKWIFAHGIIA